jgi:hypothetical protein
MTRFLKTFFFFLLAISALTAQRNGLIRGNVYDKKTGEPLSFVNVSIQGTIFGTDTNADGFFNLAEVPPGTYKVIAGFLGYDDYEFEAVVAAGAIIYKGIYLEESSVQLDAVDISSRRDQAKSEVQISKLTVTAKQIKVMPSTSGDADIAQFLTILPGVISSGDQGGQIFIRGGAPIQNRIMLDGITIFNPFHSIGFFSVFETETIRTADILTGGFNAEYGGRISAIVDIKTREGNKKRLGGMVAASPFQTRAIIEGPLVKLKDEGGGSTSFLLTGKHSYLDRTSTVLYPWATTNNQGLPFGFTDLYGKVSFVADNGSKLNLFGFNFTDRVNVEGLNDLQWSNFGAGANFVIIPGSSNVVIGGFLSYSDYEIRQQELDLSPRTSNLNGFNLGLDFSYFGYRTEVKYGLELTGFRTSLDFRNQLNIPTNSIENNTEVAGFFKLRQKYGKVVLEPGIRLQYYASLNTFSLEPRLGAKVNVNDRLRLKFAGGLYTQNLISTVNERDIVNLFVGFLSSPGESINRLNTNEPTRDRLQRAIHGIAGVEFDITDRWELNVEPYIKRFSQLINLNRVKLTQQDPNFASEIGDAYGIDFLLKYNAPTRSLWFTYSLGRVFRDDGVQIYPANFDRRHNINAVASQLFGSDRTWEMSIRWNFGTGFPFTLTQGFYQNENILGGVNIDYLTGNNDINIIYDTIRNGGRLSAFHRLDGSIKKTSQLSKNLRLESNFTITNIYNRNNIFYLERLTNERVFQLPILPSISFALFF